MKSIIIVALALVVLTVAAPAEEPEKIVQQSYDQQPDGHFVFGYETEKGINRHEEGTVKEALDEENKPHTVVVVRGSYSYFNPEGKQESINYFADETGFHAEGESIPKVPVARR